MHAQELAASPRSAVLAWPAVLLLIAGVVLDILLVFRALRDRPRLETLFARLAGRGFPSADSAALLVLILFSTVAASAWLSVVNRLPAWDDSGTYLTLAVQLVSFHGVALAGALATARRNSLSWSGAFGISRSFPRQVWVGIVLYIAAMPPVLLAAWAWEQMLVRAGIELVPQDVVEVFQRSGQGPGVYAAIVATAVLAAPVVEEIVFRGVALPLLMRSCNARLAIVTMSVVFAGIHFHLPSVVPLFFVAMSLSLAYLFTGSLVVPIVMHALLNAWSLAVCG